ncbi:MULTISPECIES: DUF2189 domain-containing protein [unclassified Mesorhizobium]|uniref:DUF2189 domain-containing protein n=1 Tax=unclassified Mesorhizobium TaxID=325217 RepID=UPI000FD8BC39|nr:MULTISPECIES: DUF2189 domain-containing protein [unclassified Mesorhizobium]TGQ30034.1 DUF2189 domain-containing protein [Mesorhizobium sp. M00.F.Ca.ET.216.01.1.1]TIS85822.1 MAG: DUF2189 domain-containing protein [Mesorhizobium sp.]TJW07051.1 MAG: DUF2189 domain-containing protein [Mesorhizobium sp.]
MSDANKPYGLLNQLSGIEETRNPERQRHLPASAAFAWLAAGWRDLVVAPSLSLAYGLLVFIVSIIFVWTMFTLGWDYILFPALAGFMIVAPAFAVGLYEKSRAIEDGEPPTLGRMLRVKPRAGAQIFFTGVLLCLLMLLWMRAAVLLYALFFGVRPFPGLDHIVGMLFTTPMGLAMLAVGTLVGGLFAAFGFAISVFSIPMLLDQRSDALTAMASSMAMVWNNLRPMIVWGAIVLALFVLSVATALVGLIVIFPLLGHATWHAYRAIR